jgi:hypothetical protein
MSWATARLNRERLRDVARTLWLGLRVLMENPAANDARWKVPAQGHRNRSRRVHAAENEVPPGIRRSWECWLDHFDAGEFDLRTLCSYQPLCAASPDPSACQNFHSPDISPSTNVPIARCFPFGCQNFHVPVHLLARYSPRASEYGARIDHDGSAHRSPALHRKGLDAGLEPLTPTRRSQRVRSLRP